MIIVVTVVNSSKSDNGYNSYNPTKRQSMNIVIVNGKHREVTAVTTVITHANFVFLIILSLSGL